MSESTSVGAIRLDLILKDTLTAQIKRLSAKAQTTAQKPFEEAGAKTGKTFSRAMTDRIESTTGKSLQAAVDRAMKKGQAAVRKGVEVPVRAVQYDSTAIQQSMNDFAANAGKSKKMPDADIDTSQTFRAAQEPVELLRQKLQNLNDQMEQTRRKMAEIDAAADAMNPTDAAGLDKLTQQATQTEARMISLQQQIDATKQKLDAAGAASIPPPEASAGRFQQLFDRIRTAGQNAFGKLGSTVSGFTKKLGSGLGNGLKRITARFHTAGKGANKFTNRLKSVVSGALVFNVLSMGLRKLITGFGTALTKSKQMRTALANLKGAFATAAAPLVELLTPALAALVNGLATVFSYVAKLTSALTGKSLKSMQQAAKAMTATGDAAAKAAKNVAGFDEMQILSDESGNASSSTITPNFAFEGSSGLLDGMLAAIKAGDFSQVGALIAEKINASLGVVNWAPIQERVRGWAANISDTFNGFVRSLDWSLVGVSAASALHLVFSGLDDFVQSFDWTVLASGIAVGLNSAVTTIDWTVVGHMLTNGIKIAVDMLFGFATTFDWAAFGISVAQMIAGAVQNIDWTQAGQALSATVLGLLQMLSTVLVNTDWAMIGQSVLDALSGIDWGSIIGELLYGLGALLVSCVQLLIPFFDAIGAKIASYFTDIGENGIEGFFTGCWNLLKDMGQWIYDHMIRPLVDGVKDALGIHSPSTVFADIGKNVVQGLYNGIQSIWSSVTGFFAKAWSGIKNGAISAWTGIVTSIKSIWGSVVKIVRAPVNSIIGLINGIISGMNSMIKGLNKIKIDVPDWVPAIGGKSIGFGLKEIGKIPYLASGGLATQPTLAMIGEYAGARSNPEVVAPLDKLQSLMESGDNSQVIALLQEIIVLLKAMKLTVNIGGKRFRQALIEALTDLCIQNGELPLPV